MTHLPYVLLNCAISLDGYLDDTSDKRLSLSNDEDWQRVDALRASCDAILVGSNTIRKDNPRLLIKSTAHQRQREKNGLTPNLIKITLTVSGNLHPSAAFFTTGDESKFVYTIASQVAILQKQLGNAAKVVKAGNDKVDLRAMLEDLYEKGVRRLLIEGGGTVLSEFLQQNLANELQIAIAPFFVGQKDAPRFVLPGNFPWNPEHPMRLNKVDKLNDLVVLQYLL